MVRAATVHSSAATSNRLQAGGICKEVDVPESSSRAATGSRSGTAGVHWHVHRTCDELMQRVF